MSTTIVLVTLGWFVCGLLGHIVLKVTDKHAVETHNPTLIYVMGPALVIVIVLLSIFQLGLVACLALAIRWDLPSSSPAKKVLAQRARSNTDALRRVQPGH
jgi:hypothetical protein